MNVALLMKWFSRYGNESKRLYRRVVYTRSRVDLNTFSLSFKKKSRRSTLVNLIGSLLDRNARVSSIVSGDFRGLIDNGLQSDFWGDS